MSTAAAGFSLSTAAAAHVGTTQLTKYEMLLNAALDALARQLVRLAADSIDELTEIGADLVRDNHRKFSAYLRAKLVQCGKELDTARRVGARGSIGTSSSSSSSSGVRAAMEARREWQQAHDRFGRLLQTWELVDGTAPSREQTLQPAARGSGHGADSHSDDGHNEDDSSDGEL